MSNSNGSAQESHLENHRSEERKQCILAKLNAIGELLHEMSMTHSKIMHLTDEMEQIQKSEEHLAYPSIGTKELNRLRGKRCMFDNWYQNVRRDLACVKRCVSMRFNDEHITCVNFVRDDKDFHYNEEGSASSITFGFIDVYLMDECLPWNTYVTDLTVPIPKSSYDQGESFNALLHYVQTSSGLRRIHAIDNGENYNFESTIALCSALGSNPHIEEIYWHSYIPPTTLHSVLEESQMHRIKLLSIVNGDWEKYPVQNRPLLPKTIANYASLVKLRLMSTSDDWTMVESILNHLAEVPTPLQQLSIDRNFARDQLRFQSLAQYIQLSTTLLHLELKGFHFHETNVEPFVEGLQYHYSLATACIRKLSMIECQFDRQATLRLCHFMIVTSYKETGPCAVLQELELSIGFEKDMLSSTVPACLSHQPPIRYRSHSSGMEEVTGNNTIVSGLKILKLHCSYGSRRLEKFCETLQSEAKHIRLPCLHILDLNHKDCLLLASCIPKLLSLQELYLDKVGDPFAEDQLFPSYLTGTTPSASFDKYSTQVVLISMIQQGGNLRMVSIRNDKGCEYLSDSQLRMTNAYCERNRAMVSIFSKTIKLDWRHEYDLSIHQSVQPKEINPIMIHSMDDNGTASLFPTLLQVVKQVQIMKVSTITKALLNLVMEGIE